MFHVRVAAFSYLLIASTLARPVSAAEPASPIPVVRGEEVAFTQQASVVLGPGPASCVGLHGDLLVVGAGRSSMGQPAVDPRVALVDDPYAIHDIGARWTTGVGVLVYLLTDQGPRLLTNLRTRYAPIDVAFASDGRFYVADRQYVYAFRHDGATVALQWIHQVDGIVRILTESPDRVFVISSQGFERLEDQGHAPALLHSHIAAVADLFPYGRTALLFSTLGQVELLEFEHSAAIRSLGTVRLLGQARLARSTGDARCLLLNQKGLEHAGLRDVMTAQVGRRAAFDMTQTTLGKGDRGRLGTIKLDKPEDVFNLLPLGDRRAWLLMQDGSVYEVDLDPAGKKIATPRKLDGLENIVAIAGDAFRQVVVDRAGRVHFVTADAQLGDALPLVEAGPWIVSGSTVFIACGPRIHRFDPTRGLAEVALELNDGYIRQITRSDDAVLVLTDRRLTACRIDGEVWRTLTSIDLELNEAPRFMSAAHGLALVATGDRTLTGVDVADPARLRVLTTVTPSFPITWGGGQGYLRDVVIEPDRVLIAAGEVHVFDRADFFEKHPLPPAPSLVIPRHYRSFDDLVQTKRIFRLRDGLYHCCSDRHQLIRRAWLMKLGADSAPHTEYTRLGTATAQDLVMLDDDVALVAAGRAGLRVIRWSDPGEGELLGSFTEPDAHFEAVLCIGDTVYVKDGNTIRVLAMKRRPRSLETAFSFMPAGDSPRIQIDGLPIESAEYQRLMGYQEALAVVNRSLGDDLGWPAIDVPQGEVWVDAQRGRLKFSDGRRTEPTLVAKLPISLWGPIQANNWLTVGKYHLAPAGELSHGLVVLDLADPDCPRQVAVAGTTPNAGYANKSLGVRGRYAFVSWNNPGPAIGVVDVADPLQPCFVRAVALQPPTTVAGHMDRNWVAHFDGDRMLVTTFAGLYVFDVKDPANLALVGRHEAVPPLTAWDLSRKLGVWIDRKHRELQFVDTSDYDRPQVRGRINLARDASIVKPINFDWHDDRLWVWGLTHEGSEPRSALAAYDVADPSQPRLLGMQTLNGELNDFLRLDDSFAALAYRNGDIESWNKADPATLVPLGRIDAAQSQGLFRFALSADGPPIPYDNRLGAPPESRYGQNTRFMMSRGRIVWTTGPIVDFTDPAKPTLRGGNMQAFDDEVRGMTLSADRRSAAWTGGVDGSRWVIDLSDPRKPAVKWRAERVAPKALAAMLVTPDFDSSSPAFVETGRAPAFVGPDSALYHNNRPMTGFFGGSQVTLVSEPISVTAGRPLTLSVIARTRPCLPRQPSSLRITVAHWGQNRRGRVLARVRDDSNLDRNTQLEAAFTPDADVRQVVVEIQADLLAWIGDLRLADGDVDLLPNAHFDQPVDERGMHRGWRLVEIPKTLERIANVPLVDHAHGRLYQGIHNGIVIHDLTSSGVFAAGFLAGAVLDDRDAILGLGLAQQGNRRLIVAATESGLTVNDVTDIKNPVTLGRLILPWNFAIRPWLAALNPDTFIITTGYTSKRQTEGIYVVDVSEPSRPRLLRYLHENGTQLSTHNGWLYKMSYRNGAQIYNLREPDNPGVICDFLFDTSNSGDAPTAVLGDVLIRAHAGGLESWLTPMPDQAPCGCVTVEPAPPSSRREIGRN